MRRLLGVVLCLTATLIVFVPEAAACAAPPPGWVRIHPIQELAGMFGPAAVAFFVPGYFALGIRRRVLRFLALIACIGLAVVVFVFTTFFTFTCGYYGPP